MQTNIEYLVSLYKGGDVSHLHEKLQETASLPTNDRYAIFNILTSLALEKKDWQFALHCLSEAIAAQEKIDQREQARNYFNRGIVWNVLQASQNAETDIEKAVQLVPDYLNAWRTYYHLVKETNKTEKTLQVLKDWLRYHPNNSEALHCMADFMRETGRYDQAIMYYDEILKLNSADADSWNKKGICLKNLDQWEVALVCYDKAISFANNPYAHNNRGNVLKLLKRPDEAIASYEEAIKLKPDDASFYINCAGLLEEEDRLKEGLDYFQKAVVINPQDYYTQQNYGIALVKDKQYEAAIPFLEKSLQLRKDNADVYNFYGKALGELHRFEEAINAYQNFVRLSPNSPDGFNNLASAYSALDKIDEAISYYQKAIALDKNYISSYTNCALIFMRQRNFTKAEDYFQQAFALDPDNSHTKWNYAHLKLMRQEYLKGWECYETRWNALDRKRREFNAPIWLGDTPIAGKRIFLWPEQGYGDMLQFCRFIVAVKALGAVTIFGMDEGNLYSIMQTLIGVDEFVLDKQKLPPFDYHCPIMSLPYALKMATLDDIPQNVPYLSATAEEIIDWKNLLGERTNPRVGLVWSTGHHHVPEQKIRAGNKSIAFELFSLINDPRIDFYSLQKGEPAESEILTIKDQYWKTTNFFNFADRIKTFSYTAGIIHHMDLVITVDTATAHLAGAMGKKVWLLNPYDTCWRWLLERNDSPWYPDMRIFRQKELKNWQSVVEAVKDELLAHFFD